MDRYPPLHFLPANPAERALPTVRHALVAEQLEVNIILAPDQKRHAQQVKRHEQRAIPHHRKCYPLPGDARTHRESRHRGWQRWEHCTILHQESGRLVFTVCLSNRAGQKDEKRGAQGGGLDEDKNRQWG